MVSMSERDKHWETVKKDFPCDSDPALQEVHYLRLRPSTSRSALYTFKNTRTDKRAVRS